MDENEKCIKKAQYLQFLKCLKDQQSGKTLFTSKSNTSSVAQQHEAAKIWWKAKLESKTVENEKQVLQSFGCRAKCEEWVYGKRVSPTDSIAK